jgi:IS605 OrfB family transposase
MMYNATLKYIKTKLFQNRYDNNFNLQQLLNYRNLRTLYLKDIRNKIIDDSQLPNHNKNTKIKCHMLDGAIQLACANYKSALSNFKNGNIKKFRIRYWKLDKTLKMLDIEKQYFKRGSFCYKELGTVKCMYDKGEYKLDNIESGCKIHYNSDTNRYILLVPEKVDIHKTKTVKTKKIISLDPGLRTFLTGLSENECIKICTNGIDTLKEKLERIDKIESDDNISKKKKRKTVKRINMKISDIVDDLHWKSIKYLTDKYETILIGDMSVKSIVSNDTSNIQKMMKRIAYKFKFYQFKQRLEYKCQVKGNKYKEIDERYTSKTCSNCGNYKEDLGGKKIYNCDGCNMKIDRDINGCRGIYIKQFM